MAEATQEWDRILFEAQKAEITRQHDVKQFVEHAEAGQAAYVAQLDAEFRRRQNELELEFAAKQARLEGDAAAWMARTTAAVGQTMKPEQIYQEEQEMGQPPSRPPPPPYDPPTG